MNGPMRYTRMNARRLGGGYSFTPQFAGTRKTNQNYPRFVLPTMRRTITALALLLVPFISNCQMEPSTAPVAVEPVAPPAVIDLAPREVAAMLGQPEVFVYDCNEADMHAEAHVPGAKLTVYDEVTAAILPADRNARLVFYCYSPECPAGAMAAKTALTFGYTNVFCMSAGIVGWQDAGLTTEP